MVLKDEVEVIIARDDWEKFVLSLEHLMALHEQTLMRLAEINRRNGLRGELPEVMPLHSPGSEKNKDHTVNAKKTPLTRLIGLLRPREFPTVGLAKCARCGLPLTKPSRFCQSCHTSFGSLVCTCGRSLNDNDKFCDRCGRKVRDAT